jgi:hypothetical protein
MTTITKTKIEPNWTAQKIQENVARIHGLTFMTAMKTLAKHGQEAVNEFQTEMRNLKVEHYKANGVKTPIDLAKAIAEFETNLFGSKIEVWGDEKAAHLQYNSCAMWDSMKKYGKFSPKQEEEMGANFDNCMQMLAKDFGFKGETKFEGETCVISFTK